MNVHAAGVAQKVTLSVSNTPLEKVFTAVEKQTGYVFFFDEGILKNTKPVSIQVSNMPLHDFLNTILKDQPLKFSFQNKTIFLSRKVTTGVVESINNNAKPEIDLAKSINEPVVIPPIDVKGRVVNENGEPVTATVTEKGTRNMVLTDENGYFIIKNVDENAILVIGGINIERFEVKVNGRTDLGLINVKAKITQLGDVAVQVSTGYQVLSKERSTGSYTHINNTVLNQQAGSNVLQRLNGVANGVLFDRVLNRPPVTVRGFSSISGPRNPLIIVDNFPYEGDINNINPNDVEDVTILKDAAAASIWGTRAGNGVIVITLKKAGINQKTKLEFNANVTFIPKPNLFELRPISSADMVDVEQMLFGKGYYDANINSLSRPGLSPAIEIMLKRRNGLISPSDAASQLEALKKLDVRNEYDKYMYQVAVNRQYALNIKGGMDKISYLFSVGYDDNISELSAKYDRLSLRSATTFRPVKNLSISTTIAFTQSNTVSGKPGYGSQLLNSTQRLYPYAQFADANGSSVPLNTIRRGYIDTAGQGKLLDWNYYPLEEYKHDITKSSSQALLGNIGIQYKFLKHFSIDLKYQYEKQQVITDNLKDLESVGARVLINNYSQLNYATGAVTYIIPKGAILDKSNALILSNNARAQITYNRVAGKHDVTAIGGSEIREIRSYGNGYRIYGYDENNLTFQNVDYVNTYRTFITGTTAAIPNTMELSDRARRFVSLFTNVAYTYDSKYTITVSARKDASNMFGVNANDKWKPLWSSGLSWNISKEDFYKSKFLPYLKLRTTYGFSGNVDPSRSALPVMRYFGAANYTNFLSASIIESSNPDLKWETVKIVNFGVDFITKKNTISGSVEYYHKNGLDLFGPAPLDYTAGLGRYTITKNVAAMKGRGVDVSITSKNINRQLQWISTFQFNYNMSKITDYYLTNVSASSFVGSGSVINGFVNKPVYSVMSYQWRGLDSAGNPQGVYNKQTTTSYASIVGSNSTLHDLAYAGSAVPVLYGNLTNTLSWRGLSLAANVTYRLGHYFRKQSIDYTSLFSSYLGNADFADRWKMPGDENLTSIPAMVYPANSQRDNFYKNSEALVRKADVIRLQFINASYDLVQVKRMTKLFDGLQLYVMANNLGIIWKAAKDVVDPDYGSNDIRPSKSFTVGLKAIF